MSPTFCRNVRIFRMRNLHDHRSIWIAGCADPKRTSRWPTHSASAGSHVAREQLKRQAGDALRGMWASTPPEEFTPEIEQMTDAEVQAVRAQLRMERISVLPNAQHKFVPQVLDSVLAQASD